MLVGGSGPWAATLRPVISMCWELCGGEDEGVLEYWHAREY